MARRPTRAGSSGLVEPGAPATGFGVRRLVAALGLQRLGAAPIQVNATMDGRDKSRTTDQSADKSAHSKELTLNPGRNTDVLQRGGFSNDAMHCPRCGTNATVGQQFCRSCGLSLEKVADLLGDWLVVQPSLIDERTRLRERQKKFEQWGGIAGLVTFGLILLTMIIVLFSQMIMKGRAMVIPGLLLILLAIGAAVMGLFQTYSKSLKEKLANPRLPRATDLPKSDETRQLDAYREPVPTVTDRTTELLAPAKTVDTGKIDD